MLPKYLFSLLISVCVPRLSHLWAFGSGIGVGEGALAVALQLQKDQPDAVIYWLTNTNEEDEAASRYGFTPIRKQTWRGYWATLRSRTLVVTHGLGDVNRFGIFGGTVVQLWHGVPLKHIHLDSAVTTQVRGPAPLRGLLRAMYARGTQQVALYVAGSIDAADRLRSAFRVDPGRVRVLGDPRDDALAMQATHPALAAQAREQVMSILGLRAGVGSGESGAAEPSTPEPSASEPSTSDPSTSGSSTSEGATTRIDAKADSAQDGSNREKLVLYAPTWRDGETDPAIPTESEIALIHATLGHLGARLIIRSHPLGAGNYEGVIGERVHLLGADLVRDITPLLGAFDAVITDYSSLAIDYALLGRPIVWFAPDLPHYVATRGMYEPLEVTSGGAVAGDWTHTMDRVTQVLAEGSSGRREATRVSRDLRTRFHPHLDGASAARVLEAIADLEKPAAELIPDGSVFFESFYGRQVSCNPFAIDREIAARHPEVARFWSVVSERQPVPEGATAVLVGSREWHAARRHSRLLIVNDWLRYGFKRRRGQTVLQTWHGTMLKHLALGRPDVSFRTRLAIRRESRRWNLLLSQNPHSTQQFRTSYAYKGEVLETGYPRDDRLAHAVLDTERNPVAVGTARARLGIPAGVSVLAYAPTWRDGGTSVVDELDVNALAAELGEDWAVVARGHTRTHAFGGYGHGRQNVIDASRHPDVNDVILAADLLVTDYSSIMFDAAVARVPLAFFVPDLERYRDRERGFTFDFERDAPGPLVASRAEVVSLAAAARDLGGAAGSAHWISAHAPAYDAWRARFAPHDDGRASARVVSRLENLGALPARLQA